MALFVPSILEDDLKIVHRLVNQLEGLVWRVHIDFADGNFVKNNSINPGDLGEIRTLLELEAHLMVEHPSHYFPTLRQSGFNRVVCHLEVMEDMESLIVQAKEYDLSIGLAINPETAVEDLWPYAEKINFIQIMGVYPGQGGQPFLNLTYTKVNKAKQLFPLLPVAVDGGVRLNNGPELIRQGAEILVVGRAGYEMNNDIGSMIRQWQALVV